MMEESRKANWLLRIFIGISLVIHFFIFLHVADIYKSKTLSYIELSMHQFSKPNVRNIPTPRVRQKKPDISKVKQVKARQFTIPKIKIDRVKADPMDQTYEAVSMPSLPDNMGIGGMVVPRLLQTRTPDIEPHEEQVEFTSLKEYREMLNLRIARKKKYPESAKSRHLEGRVKVQFVLHTDGRLTDVKVVKSSHHKNLDDAAIEAIKNASPLPKPPSFLFKKPVTIQINLLFELA